MFVKPTPHSITSISTESASYNCPSCHLVSLLLGSCPCGVQAGLILVEVTNDQIDPILNIEVLLVSQRCASEQVYHST